jgi:endonuclease/exonuclease/phosphatase family metal-dependent hydrolase
MQFKIRNLKSKILPPFLLIAAVAGLFFWASSGTLDEETYATVRNYDVPARAPGDTFTVVTYNLGYLSGMTNNRAVARNEALFETNLEAAETLLRRTDADLIALQEIDFDAARSYAVDQLEALAERLGYTTAAAAVNWDERYVPFPSASPKHHFGRTVSGQAVLSRYPISRHTRVLLEKPPRPMDYPPPLHYLAGAWYIDRLAQVVAVDAGRPLLLINVHLEAWDTPTRERQAEVVRALIAEARADGNALLVLGDFNSTYPVDAGATDRTLTTLFQGSGLREALADSVYAGDPASTFTSPADAPVRKIDHIFYPDDTLEPLDAYVVGGPGQPSDHLAVVAQFVFRDRRH